MDNRSMSDAEFCKRTGISRVVAWRLRVAGKLDYYKIGKKIRYSEKHLDEFLSRNEVTCKTTIKKGEQK